MTGGPGRTAPASFAQKSLWLRENLIARPGIFAISRCYRMRGPFDPEALRRAFGDVVTRHESLRTTFEVVDGEPSQRIGPAAVFEYHHQRVPDGNIDACRALAEADSVRPFDLSRGPLARLCVYRLGEHDHVVLLALHHLVCDAWSVGNLLTELGAFYRGHHTGSPAILPPLAMQYADHARAQHEELTPARLAELTDWWRERLAGATQVWDFPLDRRRPPRRHAPGDFVDSTLPPELAARLARVARQERVTGFMLLLAAYRLLLSRHTGQPDLLIGIPMIERDEVAREDLIGFLLNMLVLRNDLRRATTFRDVLRAERGAVIDAFDHRELPYATLVEALRPRRDLASSPLFQATFSHHTAAPATPDFPGVDVEDFPLSGAVCQFDLSLDLVQRPEGVSARWGFNNDVLTRETVARVAERFEVLLERAAADPDVPLADLPVLSPRDRAQLRAHSAESEEPTGPEWLGEMFGHWVARTPEAPAVRQHDVRLSYAEVGAHAGRVAARLRRLGLPPEARVGLLLGRDVRLPGVMLGVLGAGLSFVPTLVDQPVERVAAAFADAEVAVVLTDRPEAVPDGPFTVLDPEALGPDSGDRDATDGTSGPFTGDRRDPEGLAYVLFTSGSTGRPKGVAVTHRSLANCLRWTRDAVGFRPGGRMVAVSAVGFDISLLELFLPLVSGGEAVISTERESRNAEDLAALLARERPDFVQGTPPVWQMLLAAGWPGDPHLTVLSGGDVVNPVLARRLIEDTAGFWHIYGPTEATLFCVGAPLTAEDTDRAALPLGSPVSGVLAWVVDEELRQVPPGVVGELCLSGTALARGYLGRPGATADRFVPHPFSDRPGDRLYRTGDLAVRRTDGSLELRGRADTQIKLRGHRIELGEIEHTLAAHPDVAAVAVVLVGAGTDEAHLTAFVQAAAGAPDGTSLAAALREHTVARLPGPMVPAGFRTVAALPITENGKIDRVALAAQAAAPATSAPSVPSADEPATAEEMVLADLWRGLLPVERVGRTDDFFDSGGNSLLAVRLVNLVREAFGVRLPLSVLFEYATLAGLAERVRRDAERAPGAHSLTWLRQGAGTGRPYAAFAHAAGGSLLCYREVVAAVDAGLDVCGFERSGAPGPESLRDLADRYVTELLAAGRGAPARLVGWSVGGMLAYEMAHRLLERTGEAVPVLLIDTPSPRRGAGSGTADDAARLRLFVTDLASSLGRALPVPSDVEGRKPAEVFAELAHALNERYPQAGYQPEELARRYAVLTATTEATAGYRPAPYPGEVRYLESTEGAEDRADGADWWRERAGSWQGLVSLPADHHAIVRGETAARVAEEVAGRTAN
ncbi:amino acid adenylation domain-containing protein [Streptomyces sp. XM4011]|uniref:non-ribosomal peptide synthetase n=1 Tax=Streptomyces TaxID=1883 RepID=UPI001FF8DA48|nr:amino acid adenylation domain-containing protein [Streptomyces sp. XM4011]MCK1813215.1 amino acid adenylation domain-containing protein [Streptomyces sp. XM4011]